MRVGAAIALLVATASVAASAERLDQPDRRAATVNATLDDPVEPPAVTLGEMRVSDLPGLRQRLRASLVDSATSEGSTPSALSAGPNSTVAAVVDNGVPLPAVRAYRNAARTLARTDPSCALPWSMLAGIGAVESNHGQFAGAVVGRDGRSSPPIYGLPLDGSPGVAAIADSDDGRFDQDTVWDRAVGPMQFIPTTWEFMGADGDGDGRRDPHDLDDAALAAGSYLCSNGSNLSTLDGRRAAVYRYNHSYDYVDTVLSYASAYARGDYPTLAGVGQSSVETVAQAGPGGGGGTDGGSTLLAGRDLTRDRPTRPAGTGSPSPRSDDPAVHPRPDPGPREPRPDGGAPDRPGRPGPGDGPPPRGGPGPTDRPPPNEEPPPVLPVEVTGLVAPCAEAADQWCVGGRPVGDLAGWVTDLDLDGDCTVEPMSDELVGLEQAAAEVRVLVREVETDRGTVLQIEEFEVLEPLLCSDDPPTPAP